MTSGWALRGWILCAALLCGCETERIHPNGLRSDAGRDVAVPGAGGVVGAGGGHSGGARSADSGLVCEEATSSSLPEGATTGTECGIGPVLTADAGAPPARCNLAPCLWELMKHCRPQGGCFRQDYRAQSGLFADVSCGASNDWWTIRSGLNISSYRWTEDVYMGDCLCYRLSGEARVAHRVDWTDSANRVVAVSVGAPIVSVICGPFESLSDPNGFYAGGGLAPGFTEHKLDLDDPECGSWINPTSGCEPGCCSGNPPELPRTSL